MKKKILSAIAATLILAVCIVCLVACNPYKMDAIGGGDASAKVESNGGYVVKQGNYVYFINGYVGADADATWGAATKQGIVRAEYKDGKTAWGAGIHTDIINASISALVSAVNNME